MDNTVREADLDSELNGAGKSALWDLTDPRVREYLRIALILAVVTFLEFIIVYIPGLGSLATLLLILLSVAKFILVAQVFMHLKYDHQSFTWSFRIGMALAVAIGVSLVLVLYYGGS